MIMCDYFSLKLKDWYKKLTEHRQQCFVANFLWRGHTLLGLGVNDGVFTSVVARKVQARRVVGIDLNEVLLKKACSLGIEVLSCDLNKPLPVPDSSIDIVSSDQVIEHLNNPDFFFQEIYRVLKSGGYAVICTENLSSWHNILALLFGQQAFSQHIIPTRCIGNKFSINYMDELEEYAQHHHILTKQGLVDLALQHNFKIENFFGAGYFPVFNFKISKWFEKLDPTHSYFIGVRIRKP